ncbi:MAG: FkbM family methyltransferase [Saprospiraceae bacterium]|nr:FkbM family methyltransferase [Saprospiraceae bacterium]
MEESSHFLQLYDLPDARFYYRPFSYDRFMIDEVWLHDEYGLDNCALMSNACIIDIGAHIGAFSIRASKLFPDNFIWAFEPAMDNFNLLENNLKLNNCTNIQIYQNAIADKEEKTNLFINENHTGGHSLISDFFDEKHIIEIDTISMNTFVTEKAVDFIGYLKIDCEGSEYQILDSLSLTVWKKIHYLGVEFHPVKGYDAITTITAIQQRGFRLIRQKEGYFPGQYTAIFEQIHG